MNFSKLLFSVVILFFFLSNLYAQNPPVFETSSNETVVVNSGQNFILLSNVGDGDSTNQELSFEVISSDNSILNVDSVSYVTGNKMAVIWVSENGVLGTSVLTVEISDADGMTSKNFEVKVTEYQHHGVKFEIHDAIFWQEVVPVSETPIFQRIVQTTNMALTYNSLNWSQIPLTVSAGCGDPSLCDGHDFSTGFLKGYLVPKKTGLYHFYMNAGNDYALFISKNKKFQDATVVVANSDNHGKVGTVVNGSRKSGAVPLDSGKVYAFYATQWNVHQETGGVKWELQGEFEADFIDGSYLYPEYDTKRPDVVENLEVSSIGDKFFRVTWDSGNDDQKIKGYNIYLNGEKVNSSDFSKTEIKLDGLDPDTEYSIAVTALDLVDNESHLSGIVTAKTLDLDSIPPSPPTSLAIDLATGLAIQVSWDGAIDEQTRIYGYNLYVNGELYNSEDLIYENTSVLKVLSPDTEYNIEIEAVDAGMNVSEKSQVFVISTTAFQPLEDNLGLKTGKLTFSTEAMSYNEGLGINPSYLDGDVFNDAHTKLFKDLKPGAIRWGALGANPLSFSDYAGVDKEVTIGKFIARCNEFGAYTAFCCGVENSTDWRKDPDTFIRFLEYINGPDSTAGGQLRVAEGYSEPFLENSPGIIFEFGNEVWGGSGLHNAQIGENYNEYAAWCREIATLMKSSEYYDSTKIYLAYSSRYPSRERSYGLNEKIINGNDGKLHWTAPSGYLGGNLNYDPALPPSESELEYYQNVRNRADSYLSGMLSSHKYEVAFTGRLMEMYMYESNTTTPTYNGRLGQALVSTDYYLTSMELASAIPTIFHLTGGQWRITEPENDYRPLPLFLTAKYFNHFCKGDVLSNVYNSNEKGMSGTGAGFNERPVGIHTYRNEMGYSVVLISRDYENDHYVQLELAEDFNYNSEGKLYLLTGEDFNTKNTLIDTTEVTIKNGMVIKVPKHSFVLLSFGAENIEMENLPLAYYPYPKIEEIEINNIRGGDTFVNPLESKQFSATIKPSNSWDKQVKWTLLNNSGNFSVSELGAYCTVSAKSDLSNETDSLILRATSRIGDVYDEFVLYLPKSVGAEEINNQENFKLYPNPAKNSITVELPDDDVIRIYSVNGLKVLEKEVIRGKQIIDIGFLPQGFYTVQVRDKSKRLVISE